MCSRQRLPFLLVEDQPRQSTSRPGSILDGRGGNESAESSRVQALGRRVAVPNGQEGEQPGGPQHYGMSAAPKSTIPREAVVVSLAGSRAWIAKAKADVVGEELVKCTRRTAGVGDVALQERRAGQKREGPRDQPWVAQAARTPSIRQLLKGRWEARGSAHGPVVAQKEGNASGAKGPWAKAVRSGANGWDSDPRKSGEHRLDETRSKPNHTWRNARHRLNRVCTREGFAGKVFVSNRTGEISPSGMIEGDAGNGLRFRIEAPAKPR
jgi:hypothetical protein